MNRKLLKGILSLLILTGCSMRSANGVTLHPVRIDPIQTHQLKSDQLPQIEEEPEIPVADQISADLILGDVWQVSFAQDPQSDLSSLLEFMEFDRSGELKISLFSGESFQGAWSCPDGSIEDDGSYRGILKLEDMPSQDGKMTCETEFYLLPGRNLDEAAAIDYSSLLLTFPEGELRKLTLNQSGSTLLTTSGLSSEEADAFLAEQKENSTPPAPSYSALVFEADTIEEACWNFYRAKGLSPEQTAGILGNIKIESDFNPNSLSASGTYFGLFQLASQRRAAMEEMGGRESFVNQLEYIWLENFTDDHEYSNKNYRAMQDNFFGTDPRGGCIDFNESGHTVEEYAVAFMMNVERCYTPQTDWQKPSERAAYARAYYNLFS